MGTFSPIRKKMNMGERTFEDVEAVRSKVPLLIGISGASFSGKTYSALELATGIQTVVGGDIFVIDTEARRASHYVDYFKFRHVEFNAPFNPLAYLAAVRHCVARKAGVIVIDSASHEHDGDGGVLDMHDRAAANTRGPTPWVKPKAERRAMINGIVQSGVPMIFCFRAGPKLDWKKKGENKEPTDLGIQPIGATPLFYEMTARFLLPAGSGGVPSWNSEIEAERELRKRPRQFDEMFRRYEGKPLSRDMGREMAQWAAGVVGAECAAALEVISAAGDLAALEMVAKTLNPLQKKLTRAEWENVKAAAIARKALLSRPRDSDQEPPAEWKPEIA